MFINRWMDKEVVVHIHNGIFSSVQFSCSVMSNSLRPHGLQHTGPPCPSPTLRVHLNSCPSNNLILCSPLLSPPSIFPSIRVFSNKSDLRIRWPKYWSFSFNISPSNEHPGLISFRMDWFDLAVQGTFKSLLQHLSKSLPSGSFYKSFILLYQRADRMKTSITEN